MNKKLKIATIAVSAVMAGSMAFGMFGCTKGGGGNTGDGKIDISGVTAEDIAKVTLNINIGDNAQRSISFGYGELLSGTVKLPDGKDYQSSSLKPAWAAFEKMVGCKFNDVWQNGSNKVTNAADSKTSGQTLADMDIITDGAANISSKSSQLLNLNDYLDEMPNYKQFLADNPIVRLSLTSNTSTGAMYYAPYFDGNNDIEKYNLFKINWVQTLLDGKVKKTDGTNYIENQTGDETTTWLAHAKAKKVVADSATEAGVSVANEMGTTDWTVDVLDKDGKTVKNGITVSYTKALAAAKSNAGLGKAYSDAVGSAYAGTSGNIIDIMNAAINTTKGAITGHGLREILREYIRVAYYVAGSETPFYTREGYNLSDVFVGYSAAWDVDLYAALGRVLVTNPSILLSGNKGGHVGDKDVDSKAIATPYDKLYLHCSRAVNMQRQSDMISMVGQLYGVRGLESKNLWTYIGSDGKVKFAPNDLESYEAMNKFHTLYAEGLIADYGSGSNGQQSYYDTGSAGVEALTTYDYVNTQTPAGFIVDGKSSSNWAIEDGYNYGPAITPVANWNDGAAKKMRFTESWRTTKDTGFCIPKANVKQPAKLAAVLKFIDCMFSNDGQILLTYGPKASSATANDGFWYNPEATTAQVASGEYFEYDGKKLWSDVNYGGVYQPKPCDKVYAAYYGESVNNFKYDGSSLVYAGDKFTMPAADDDITPIEKNGKLPVDAYAVKSNGTYEKVAKDTKISNACALIDGVIEGINDGKAVKVMVDNDKNKGQPVAKDGKVIPLMKSGTNQWAVACTLNYTNFARYVIGSTLPLGNKLQSYEFQFTSSQGRAGALVVDAALDKKNASGEIVSGVVRHTWNSIETNLWYTVVPTVLPYSKAQQSQIERDSKDIHTGDNNMPFSNNKDCKSNVYFEIMKNGYDAAKINALGTSLQLDTNVACTAQSILDKVKAQYKMVNYVDIKNAAWQSSLNYYNTKLKG